jgi:hypothetical protein
MSRRGESVFYEEELAKLRKKKLYSKDPQIALKAFEMAMHYTCTAVSFANETALIYLWQVVLASQVQLGK